MPKNTNANVRDAAKLLKYLTLDQLSRLDHQLKERKIYNILNGRATNTRLLRFVEKKLAEIKG